MRGLSAPTSLANLEREGGQPRSGWGVGEVADTPCAPAYRCAIRPALPYVGSLYHVSRHVPPARLTPAIATRYAGAGGGLFAYRAVWPARRDKQIRRPFLLFPALPSCVKFTPLWLAQSRVDLHQPQTCGEYMNNIPKFMGGG